MPVVNFNKWAYRLVEDRQDGISKVPVFDHEAFEAGITFKAKYVGTLEITRPTSRNEIVTAMRKVRCEFKIKGIEKRRIFLTISVDGIKVTLRRRRRRLRKEYLLDDEPVVLHEHQIGRIFYVSHDSMDLKIFSYITKDNFDNHFRCSVFKAYRKSRALFIVRTIGQAFEVCHRLQEESGEESKDNATEKVDQSVLADEGTDIDAVNLDVKPPDEDNIAKDEQRENQSNGLVDIGELVPSVGADGKVLPFTVEQLRALFNQQLQHYMLELGTCKGENLMLNDQLKLERNARVQSQEREKLLLRKNGELLQTIQMLVDRLRIMNPGDDSLTAAAFTTSGHAHTLANPGNPSMFSTPLHPGNLGITRPLVAIGGDEHLACSGGESVVITPPADAIATFDPLASKEIPSVTLESLVNYNQASPGENWKTFDDDVTSPESGHDDSSSESSEDEHFSEGFGGREILPAKERNGWVDLNDDSSNGNFRVDPYAAIQPNGYLHNDLKSLQLDNTNHIGHNAASSGMRTAVQTDF